MCTCVPSVKPSLSGWLPETKRSVSSDAGQRAWNRVYARSRRKSGAPPQRGSGRTAGKRCSALVAILEATVSDDQRTPEEDLDLRIAQNQRQGWELVWCREDSRRARMRTASTPVSPGLSSIRRAQSASDGRPACLDFTIGPDDRAVWHPVPCERDDQAI